MAVRRDQALLYRLTGDRNPLHADPAFAAPAGFDRPILHGLCTYGMTLKAVVDTLLDGDVTRVRSCATRFAGVVHPGETLRVRMWRGDGEVTVAVSAVDRGEAPVYGHHRHPLLNRWTTNGPARRCATGGAVSDGHRQAGSGGPP